MLTYLLLSALMAFFKPEIGEFIASSIGMSGNGWVLWIIGLVISFIVD
jgi:energy-converting hydrogenase Eha subunit G